ncbi:conserved hypothetical protein [Candidatus Koribacter versatilis Ellin345]|uniref:Activator of Hsp90 ATPase homologue 1/2-like C-terminal domain-containing protein n=1 Tax=Koribacter versatilis (strain Ellin345) TaxID=204669 RepID=Q1IJS4_KORVE|nr:SRPBCC family protein [Candidatus Koribacter versatilis]ABF42876.1 conserved hypothetical protein [Candidatus Koribacter versatilis Ellin345]
MTKAIQQSVTFPASARELFETYVDSRKHTASTGMPAKISRKVGGKFSGFGGMIGGRNLMLVPGQMIVQAWRSAAWKKTDANSILTITFTDTKSGGRVDLVHVNVPAHDHRGVTEGWKKYYWKPWRAYFRKQKKES